MKTTCGECKALRQDRFLFTCELGYEIKIKDTLNPCPITNCPKPTTIKKLIEIKLRSKD
jgi:hypothetical protein